MLMSEVHRCPECGGAVDLEHVAEEDLRSHMVTYLYCEFCGLGLETLWRHKRHSDEKLFDLQYRDRDDAIELGKFLQRLHDARAA